MMRAAGLTVRDAWPVVLALILFGAFTALVCFRPWPFNSVTWREASDLGGAYNILAALFSGLAFAGLIITILIQARELRLQREQLALQRGELARLANAQDLQNYALLMSAYVTAEAFEKRLSSGGPSPEFVAAFNYLKEFLQTETARRRQSDQRS